jgi:hypothetical protein
MLVSWIFKTPVLKNNYRQWEVVKDAPQDISGHHEMKLWASEQLLSCQLQRSCIKLNKKLNSFQSYNIVQITEFYTEWFSVCPIITSKF